MKDRVCSDALVMPSSTGWVERRTTAARFGLGVLGLEVRLVEVIALDQAGVAGLEDFDLLQHLADDRLDVLVVDRHALQAIDLLNFVDQEVGQSLDAQDAQDVVRIRIAVDDVVALRIKSPSWTEMCLPLGIRNSTGIAPSSGVILIRRLFL